MKTCSYCAEEIQENAIKCKHCGEQIAEKEIEKSTKSDNNILEKNQCIQNNNTEILFGVKLYAFGLISSISLGFLIDLGNNLVDKSYIIGLLFYIPFIGFSLYFIKIRSIKFIYITYTYLLLTIAASLVVLIKVNNPTDDEVELMKSSVPAVFWLLYFLIRGKARKAFVNK